MSRTLNNTEKGQLVAMASRTSPEEVRKGFDTLYQPAATPRVLISVSGGNAEFETHGAVEVDKVDFDDLAAEGLSYEQREAQYKEMEQWLKTGELK